ncbi:hypothetical protein [Geomonas edaphica]|uniref:hypothetical protein n=1 Tax=Geomonas edaphica TaxID=2570226 RepID=UPI0010A888FA|nr:hypothetical protein [Geomonas edaphica]
MEISPRLNSTTLPLVMQTLASSPSASSAAAPAPPTRDQVQVSDEALAASGKAAEKAAAASDTELRMLGELLSRITGSEVQQVSYQDTELSAASASLSYSGTIATRDGKELGFGLQIQYEQVSMQRQAETFQADGNGLTYSYEADAAEFTSRSFSFTLSAGAEGEAVPGKGLFHLNDEVSRIAKEMKPMVKEFMAATGAHGGWGEANRLLRSTV